MNKKIVFAIILSFVALVLSSFNLLSNLNVTNPLSSLENPKVIFPLEKSDSHSTETLAFLHYHNGTIYYYDVSKGFIEHYRNTTQKPYWELELHYDFPNRYDVYFHVELDVNWKTTNGTTLSEKDYFGMCGLGANNCPSIRVHLKDLDLDPTQYRYNDQKTVEDNFGRPHNVTAVCYHSVLLDNMSSLVQVELFGYLKP